MERQIQALQELLSLEVASKKRAIITWIEPDGEWEVETLQQLLGDSVQVRELNEQSILQLKREIERESRHASFVLYTSRAVDSSVLDALHSVIGCGTIFKSDDVSVLASKWNTDEMSLRRLKMSYPKFFNAARRVSNLEKILKQTPGIISEIHLLAVLTNSTPDIKAILQALLQKWHNHDYAVLIDIEKMEFTHSLITAIKDYLAVEHLTEDFMDSVTDIIITSAFLHEGGLLTPSLVPLKSHKINQLADLHHQMLEDKSMQLVWLSATKKWAERYQIHDDLRAYALKELLRFQTFVVVDEVLLERIRQDILQTEFPESLEHWRAALEQRELVESVYYTKQIRNQYSYLLVYLELRNLLNEILHILPIEPSSLQDLYEDYVQVEYKIDQLYRHLSISVEGLDDEVFLESYESIQHSYEQNYLLTRAAQAVRLVDQVRDSSNIPVQTSFYEKYVQVPRLMTKAKQYVIISDALRYEAGVELAERLQSNVRASVTCRAMQASIPTFTKLDMASLLPQSGKMTFQNNIVYIGGKPTSGLQDREKVLQQESTAIAYNLADFMRLRVSERNIVVRGKEVVYLYHNIIDALGDKAVTEHKAFAATTDAIFEIETAVRALIAMEAKRIVVTADHGYLFLSEKATTYTHAIADRVEAVEGNNRFLLYTETSNPSIEYGATQVPQEHTPLSKMKVILADGLNRFRRGNGTKFMHGGITAQERITPVIVVEAAGSGNKQVAVSLLDSNRLITTRNPKFVFYQTDVIQPGIQERLVRISLQQNKQRVSNVVRCIFDAKKRSELEYRIELKLFELDYPLQSEVQLIIESPDGNGNWLPYQSYSYFINILPHR